jgi:hypothetical protein
MIVGKMPAQKVLVALLHWRGLEVLCTEVWVVTMGESDKELMNSSLLQQCLWLSLIFTIPVDVLFGDILMYPHHTKSGQCHATT